MSRKPSGAPPRAKPSHPQNPRDIVVPPLDTTPPRRAVRPPSDREQPQDKQPVDPVPLMGEAPNPGRGTREHKNG